MVVAETLIKKISTLPVAKIDEVNDFVDFLAEREAASQRSERAAMIAAYAAENAGTEFDLDEDLENAGIELLLTTDEDPHETR